MGTFQHGEQIGVLKVQNLPESVTVLLAFLTNLHDPRTVMFDPRAPLHDLSAAEVLPAVIGRDVGEQHPVFVTDHGLRVGIVVQVRIHLGF